jgi:hypothetical protein
MTDEDSKSFTREVHSIVRSINEWMNVDHPDPMKLMPALAVVLGRITANSASNLDDVKLLLDKAVNVMRNAALEHWSTRYDSQN